MIPFTLAAALSAAWLALHLVAGGRQILRPLRLSALDPVVRDTHFLCWHFTSVAIGAMAVFFTLAAVSGIAAYGVAGAGLAAAFWLCGVGLVIALRQRHADLPQGWLFLPVAFLGLWGILA
ncbi:hypothetical protein [Roseicyclus mahoneyensis]|uniref:Uncharacterized protein n=1 Tax=Roseicyclus mahoneyensis TaxID=164332 RepID=A0A316GHL4_9RHOB|nr:hypothetical protein [Roseicyclus mahoneyensis]PWK60061.1 hypothetical protein C7455_10544 [Roseicyclus mahoneyensis]